MSRLSLGRSHREPLGGSTEQASEMSHQREGIWTIYLPNSDSGCHWLKAGPQTVWHLWPSVPQTTRESPLGRVPGTFGEKLQGCEE